jgi:pyridoxal phosphate enzyme (YggS family)
MGLSERLAAVNDQIAAVCARTGRATSEVTLVGVTKTFSPEIIKSAIESGLRTLGENRVQEASTKITDLNESVSQYNVKWHLIGHLQSIKVRRAVELFDAIQTVDDIKLAERINAIAGEAGKLMPVFIEVNLGNEDSKSGVAVNQSLLLCDQTSRLAHLELRGLMAVPPYLEDPQEVRPFFRRLRQLRDEAQRTGAVGEHFKELSMGMSNDFEVAIEEGATLIRVGTAIFGTRNQTNKTQ